MLTEVMRYYGLVRPPIDAGFFETEHHVQVSRDTRAAILGGRMVALTAVIGSGKTILAVRGHAAEFGIVAAKNISHLPALLEAIAAEAAVPDAAKAMLAFLGTQVAQLDEQIAELERRMKQQHKTNPVSQLLAEIPGIGPIGALSLALTIDSGRFQSGRHFAAWLGLTPKEHSTGGRQRLGGISRAGNERLRQLLVVGAMAVIRYAKPGSKSASAWLLALLERKPRKLAAVALANKMARIVWAMMASGEAYRGSKRVATQAAGTAAIA